MCAGQRGRERRPAAGRYHRHRQRRCDRELSELAGGRSRPSPGRPLASRRASRTSTTLSHAPSRRAQGRDAGRGMLASPARWCCDVRARASSRYGPLEALGVGAREHLGHRRADRRLYRRDLHRPRVRRSDRRAAGHHQCLRSSRHLSADCAGRRRQLDRATAACLALSLLNLAAVLVGRCRLRESAADSDSGWRDICCSTPSKPLRGGRPLPPAAQEWAYRAGFAVMASLFLFATWNDITTTPSGCAVTAPRPCLSRRDGVLKPRRWGAPPRRGLDEAGSAGCRGRRVSASPL